MKPLPQAILLSLLLTGFAHQLAAQETSKPPSDSELRQKVAGVWKHTSDTSKEVITKNIYTFATTGFYSREVTIIRKTNAKTTTVSGTWKIENGYIVVTATKIDPTPPGPKRRDTTSQVKVVSVDAHSLVFENDQMLYGTKNQLKNALITLTR